MSNAYQTCETIHRQGFPSGPRRSGAGAQAAVHVHRRRRRQGLHHLVWEIVDNLVDEYLNGHADSVTVTLHKSGDAETVADNGRGIPVDIHPKYGKPGLELILTTLHSGFKFGDGESCFHSGGLHGVGASVVNALSRKLVAVVRRDGYEWKQTFKRGKPTTELEQVGPFRGHGTSITFEPDPDIFKTTQFDPHLIRAHLEDMSYIHSGLEDYLQERRDQGGGLNLTPRWRYPGVSAALITEGQKAKVTEGAVPAGAARRRQDGGSRCSGPESTEETIRSYVNGIRTSSGGTHESGFKKAIVKAIREFIATHEVKTKGLTITAEDIREGLVGILSVFVRDPLFQGQTKERLNNEEMTAVVDAWVRPALESWVNANMTAVADQIVGPDRAGGQARGRLRAWRPRRSSASRPRNDGSTCRAIWPTARRPVWTRRNCSSWRATRPAAVFRATRGVGVGRRPEPELRGDRRRTGGGQGESTSAKHHPVRTGRLGWNDSSTPAKPKRTPMWSGLFSTTGRPSPARPTISSWCATAPTSGPTPFALATP